LATGVGGAAKAGIKVTEKAITKVANAAKKEVIEAGKVPAKAGKVGTGVDNTAGMSSTKHPLLEDAIPRDGNRLVVDQGVLPTCGHNSCGMVMDTMGKPVDILELISKTPPTAKGITSHQVSNILKSKGVDSTAWTNRNVNDLARYTANGTPVVVRIVDKIGGSNFSHFVVVDGVTKRNGIPVVAIRDPWGKQYFSPISTFQKNFSGDVIVPKGWQK
ncbi:cysteine peptidase family C39 domain-containing protein, partial [Snodgrassella communis]|uniref:cysteine peptidase family C39 domain-containing protein n=1 Tax=Snodgrassella communis TaxID=2946699 RepID=UPI001EF40F55